MQNEEILEQIDFSDSARTELGALAKVRQYMFLGRLPEAIRLIQENMPSPSHQAIVLLLRCLLLQGRFIQAESICQTVLTEASSDDSMVWEIRLWQSFLQIYTRGDTAPALSTTQTILQQAQQSPGMPLLVAQAQVLLGKTLAIAVDWSVQPIANMQEAWRLLALAVDGYHAVGAIDEAFNATLSLGQIYLIETTADSAKARVIFQDAQTRAFIAGNWVRFADATLRLAEIDFDAAPGNEAITPEHLENLPVYQQALDLYTQAGYVLGRADVFLSLGRRFITHGFDGATFLKLALEDYQQKDNLVGMQNAFSTLSTWYTRQGQLSEALSYHKGNMQISQQMGMAMGQAVASMGLGDYYYRTAHYAQALAYYEQAEKLTSLSIVGAVVGLAVTNIYTFMKLPERAERVCRTTIAALEQGGPSTRLSLARYILGNILSGTNAWSEAIGVWRVGLAEDEIRHDCMSQAQKLQSIAQATVMQYYDPKRLPIPEAAYQEAMSLYAQSIALLEGNETPEARAIVANTYQLQGQTAVPYGQSLAGIDPLQQAASIYESLDMTMQVATTCTLLGLLYYDLGNRGQTDLYMEAVPTFEKAIEYFRRTQMFDMVWKVLLYLALTLFHLGRFALTGDEQKNLWLLAVSQLEEADAGIERVRGQFIEADAVNAQIARIGLVTDKEKVYVTAIQLYYFYLKDVQAAFMWLERLKGRTFLDELALTSLHSPAEINQELLDREHTLLQALHHANSQVAVFSFNEQLHALWDQMAANADPILELRYLQLRDRAVMSAESYEWKYEITRIKSKLDQLWDDFRVIGPEGAEYVELRKATPLNFDRVRLILKNL